MKALIKPLALAMVLMAVSLVGGLPLAGPGATPARAASPLVADLSQHLVAITTGFTGTEVLLFGAIEGGGDVVVVVRGPDRRETVRRKTRIAGIWVNGAEMSFDDVPAFYWVGASHDLDAIMADSVRLRHGVGADHLQFKPVGEKLVDLAQFRKALVRNKRRQGLYGREVGKVSFLGLRLFRTRVYFPANVPTGTYKVQVFLLRDGAVASAQTTPLIISKIGLGAEVYDFAHREAALYGIIAIIIALSAGLLVGFVFRKM